MRHQDPIMARLCVDPAHHNETGRDTGDWAGLDLNPTKGINHD